MEQINVKIILPNGEESQITCKKGEQILNIANKMQEKCPNRYLGALLNNKIVELTRIVEDNDSILKFFTIKESDGKRFYIRSMFFLLIKAAKDMFPHAEMHIEYSIGNGYYCYFEGLEWITAEEVSELEEKMREIVKNDIPFIRKSMPTKDALELFEKADMHDKVELLRARNTEETSVYFLGDTIDYFYGYFVPSTSYLDNFRVEYYKKGLILLLPSMTEPQKIPAFQDSPKFFNIIKEQNEWLEILELNNCAKLNKAITTGKDRDVILISEALHEKKLASIADQIHRRREVIKIISLAGPSASGKTTTAKRLAVQLKVNGFKPFLISIDNYFVDREKTPIDENGEHDFEALEAIDVKLFNEHLNKLLNGEEIYLQKYDFQTGKSMQSDKKLRLPKEGILIVEGIHGLNPGLFENVSYRNIFKIYISALTQLNIDHHNRIPTTDGRMLRRMVRDAQFRNHSAAETIARWPSVRRGEEKYIFPYQENADIMFNSTLVYEFSLLKKYALPLLQSVADDAPEKPEAKRLEKFLEFFEEIDDKFIPPTSIMREFIGSSVFKY